MSSELGTPSAGGTVSFVNNGEKKTSSSYFVTVRKLVGK